MAEDIAQWLDSLGLGQYAQAFADNGILEGARSSLETEAHGLISLDDREPADVGSRGCPNEQ